MGLLDYFESPEGQLGLSLLSAAGPSATPMSLGQRMALGMQSYRQQRAEQEQMRMLQDYRQAQIQQLKETAADKEAQRGLKTQLAEDLNKYGITGFTPEMLAKYKLGGIDLYEPYKIATNGGAEFGLEPKLGINPNTGKQGFFVQDKGGRTRWLEAAPPPNYQVIPGSDYKPPSVIDTRNPFGGVTPVPAAPGQEPAARPPGIPGVVSPKVSDELRGKEYEDGAKRLNALRDALNTHARVLPELNRFGELNRNSRTGGADDLFGISKFNPLTSGPTREMESITARLTPMMRPPGSGATSDYEMRQYRLGTVSIDNPGPTNQKIRENFVQNLDLGRAELAFKEKWLAERGSLTGADEAWLSQIEKRNSGGKTVVRTGTANGRKVVQYSDGTVDYAD